MLSGILPHRNGSASVALKPKDVVTWPSRSPTSSIQKLAVPMFETRLMRAEGTQHYKCVLGA